MANWKKLLVSGSIAEFSHISSSGNIVPTDNFNGDLGSINQGWNDLYLADDGVIQFGNHQDVTLTHVQDQGLLLNSSNALQFNDSETGISSSTDGTLDIYADTQLKIDSPWIDIKGNKISGSATSTGSFGRLEVAGDAVIGGHLTFGDSASDSVSFVADISSSMIPDVDTSGNNDNSNFDLGSDLQRWHDFYQSGSSFISSSLFDVDSTGDVTFDINSDTANAFRVTTYGGTSEQITFTSEKGSTDGADGAGAILLDAQAGGIGLAWADSMDLWAEGGQFIVTANHATTGAIKLHADATTGDPTTQTIEIVNTPGTTEGAISITSTAGGVDIDAATSKDVNISGGQLLFSSKTNEKNAIQLTTNVGSGETISIGNKQGTGIWTSELSTAAINISASVGGIAIASHLGLLISSSAGDVDVYSEKGSVNLTSNFGAGDSIKINASDAAGGIDIDAGTGGIDIQSTNQIDIDTTAATEDININAQLGSVLIDGGEDIAKAVAIGTTGGTSATLYISSSGTGASAIDIDSAGGLDIDTAGAIDIDATGNISITSSADIEIKGDANLSIGDAVTNLNFDGAGAIYTSGSTTFDLDTSGNIGINSTGGTITIGGDDDAQHMYIGTGAAARTISIGNATAGTIVNIDGGSGANSIDIDSAGGIAIDSSDTTNGIGIGANSSGTPLTIGHTASEVTIGQNLTVNNNTIIGGNLIVNGTTTTITSTTIQVADAFIFNASGSSDGNPNVDGGIVVQSGSIGLTGSAMYHDIDAQRWAVGKQVASSGTAVTAEQKNGFVVTVKSIALGGVAPHSLSDGTSATNVDGTEASSSYGVGEIIIDSGDNNDIWILG